MEQYTLKIITPMEGDMLHAGDAVKLNDTLLYPVKMKAPATASFTVNGISAKYSDDLSVALIPLDQYKNVISVKEVQSGETQSITVYRLSGFAGKYRLSIDDNIWFLRDIHRNEKVYQSIFDNPYLGLLKKMHQTYGCKIHFNLFYQTIKKFQLTSFHSWINIKQHHRNPLMLTS